MTMTLEQVRDWHRAKAEGIRHGLSVGNSTSHDMMADAIDAHLTQPAQSVAAKDAEIDRLTRGNIGYAQDNVNLIGREHIALKRAESAESRLAAANALLREMRDGAFNIGGWADAIDEYFQEHLQESGDEA